jgi:hypothetical protein
MAIDRRPKAPPTGYQYIGLVPGDSDQWRIEWLDANRSDCRVPVLARLDRRTAH